ncbi:hypothetical protein H7J76_27620 [Mycolicibacterium fortuitum]|uniref:hypothetical protein n=1 Tax=Mycolicibacterium fortuitum TaxID=1766 RepID=UPI0010423FB7|nr:hypothetical protein [Mycolicibacterium fortuitum]MCV7142913.1 hypothetical protein [Mycolicibacterium fortuitum]
MSDRGSDPAFEFGCELAGAYPVQRRRGGVNLRLKLVLGGGDRRFRGVHTFRHSQLYCPDTRSHPLGHGAGVAIRPVSALQRRGADPDQSRGGLDERPRLVGRDKAQNVLLRTIFLKESDGLALDCGSEAVPSRFGLQRPQSP